MMRNDLDVINTASHFYSSTSNVRENTLNKKKVNNIFYLWVKTEYLWEYSLKHFQTPRILTFLIFIKPQK